MTCPPFRRKDAGKTLARPMRYGQNAPANLTEPCAAPSPRPARVLIRTRRCDSGAGQVHLLDRPIDTAAGSRIHPPHFYGYLQAAPSLIASLAASSAGSRSAARYGCRYRG